MKKSNQSPTPSHRPDHRVVIIGAGFSGINMGIRLKQQGITDFVILERAGDIGGTWRDNIYPGCACDVPSIAYSYSFAQHADWSRSFAGSAEIQDYIRRCVRRYDLAPWIRLNAGVSRASFNEGQGSWTLELDNGERISARAVVSAVGGLVNPSMPEIAGLDNFRGEVFHTARWRSDVNLTGKRVAVIGTGASAIQVIPSIQPQVERLDVYQRTPPWVLPKPDFEIAERTKRLFANLPTAQRLLRNTIFLASEAIFGPLVILDTKASSVLEHVARRNLVSNVPDPALREKLTPKYRIGCKRVLLSSDYYPAMTRENVRLVTEPIARVTPTGIKTGDGKIEKVDVIVLATGFRVDIGSAPFEIVGRNGKSLSDAWSNPGSKAYLGMSVAGFPNWFFMLGPNTGPGHTSVLVYTEAQANYIAQAIGNLFDRRLRYLDVRRDAQDAWHRMIQGRMKYTSWTSGCSSWYLDKNGENHALFPGLASEYVWRARQFRPEHYDATVYSASA